MALPATGDMVFSVFFSVGAVVASVAAGTVAFGAGWVAITGTSSASGISAGISSTVSCKETSWVRFAFL